LGSLDDAGVFKLRDDLAIIQTLDFFTPIVDDPYAFGQIAAANALSDIYAMGGVPLTAMNIICFPIKNMDISVLHEILAGGLDKIKEAGAFLVGGHSITDQELKYGLSITGTIHPEEILTNKGARAGDRLILTKPIGTGIVNTAVKGNLAGREIIDHVTALMSSLNRPAAEEIKDFDVSACTDVTGFGLFGHVCEMIEKEPVGVKIFVDKVPLIPDVIKFAKMGIVPGGAHSNRTFRHGHLVNPDGIDPVLMNIMFDPQTSGGLLIAVNQEQAPELLKRLREKGAEMASVIGEFVPEPAGKVVIQNLS